MKKAKKEKNVNMIKEIEQKIENLDMEADDKKSLLKIQNPYYISNMHEKLFVFGRYGTQIWLAVL